MSDASKLVTGIMGEEKDPELYKGQIDHDFFDNCEVPRDTSVSKEKDFSSTRQCTANTNGDTPTTSATVTAVTESSPQVVTSSKNFANELPKESQAATDSPPLNNGLTKELSISVPPEILEYPYQKHSGGIFSIGKLLASLTQPELTIQVDTDEKIGTNGGSNLLQTCDFNHENSLLHSAQASSHVMSNTTAYYQTNGYHTTLTDYEDSNEDSDSSDDEELFEMLEKYYDLIDAEESDFSDITEVSPMSSTAASPLPPVTAEDVSSTVSNLEEVYVAKDEDQNKSAQKLLTDSKTLNNILTPPKLCILTPEEDGNNKCVETHKSDGQCSTASSYDETTEFGQCKSSSPGCQFCEKDAFTQKKEFAEEAEGAKSLKKSSAHNTNATSLGHRGHRVHTNGVNGHRRHLRIRDLGHLDRRIHRDRDTLKIVDHHPRAHHHVSHYAHHHLRAHHGSSMRPLPSSASIARLRQHRKIEHENLLLLRRLQSVKASKEIQDAFKPVRN